MTDYSENQINPFANIKLRHVSAMLSVLGQSGLREEQHIRRRYLNEATHFEPVLNLLTAIGMVRRDASNPTLLSTNGLDGASLPTTLVSRIASTKGPYRDRLCSYLRTFVVQIGKPRHRPLADGRGEDSDLRNLLIEADVVSYNADEDQYILQPPYYSLYVESCIASVVAPNVIDLRRQADVEFGLNVEYEIVTFERQRLGKSWEDRVRHIAPQNAAAGYDIESVTLVDDGGSEPRFIEVKAVSADNQTFFWTKCEIDAAKVLRSWYYLYLVPIGAHREPQIDQVHIISDPITNVLDAPHRWSVEPTELKCAAVPVA
jgi:hypothetical protein